MQFSQPPRQHVTQDWSYLYPTVASTIGWTTAYLSGHLCTNRWLVQHGRSSNLGRASFVSSLSQKKERERGFSWPDDEIVYCTYLGEQWHFPSVYLTLISKSEKTPHEVIIHNPTHFLSVVTSSERYDGYVVFAPCSSCFCFFVFFEMSWKHMYCTYWWSRVAGAVMCVGRVDIRRRLS